MHCLPGHSINRNVFRANMKKKYLLTCRCGRSVPVESNQAGLSVSCACGETIDVPSFRELSSTARVIATDTPESASLQTQWGPREATIFLGLALMATAAGVGAYLFFNRPTPPRFIIHGDRVRQSIEALTLEETFELWQALRGGIREEYVPDIAIYNVQRNFYVRQLSLTALIGIVGLLVVGLGITVLRGTSQQRRGRRAQRASTGV